MNFLKKIKFDDILLKESGFTLVLSILNETVKKENNKK